MNRILKKFLQRGVDLSPVGVELREDNTNYFCTPKGASVFGWAGIDGIHFCFIRGFGEMVFSVSPMNTSPDYVHPVAENFTDFLRLILACGDVAAVEQAWMWNEAQFEAFLNENPTTQEQQQTLSEISEKMNLLPMEQPWTYIKNLQSSFDYSQIKYTEDYYDNDMTSEAELVAPEWKVYFDGDFWGHRGKDRAGKEIKLDKQFDWAGYHWVIPAAYSCSKGLVVDFCMRVDSESIRDFMKKWNLDWENDSCENFTREQQMQMEWENPLCFNFKPCLKLNEKILQTTHGCAVSFNPCLPDGVINELEAKWAIDHYGLDSTYGWVICRDVFPWGTKHHPEINKLFLTMEQQPGQVPGSHFKVHAPGDSFMFSHPVSGITHILTVQEIEQQTVPQNSFGSDRWIYPTHYIAMSYTLTPEPMENISVFDCDEGDRPIEVTPDDHSFRPVGSSSCFVVGVIGGADGPTAVIYGTNSQEKLHAACSALHFEPVGDDVEWRIVFNVTQFDKETWVMNESTGIREKDGQQLSLNYTYWTDLSLAQDMALAIKTQLAEVGIDVTTTGQDQMTWWTEGVAGNYDITTWNTEGSYTEPHKFLQESLGADPHAISLQALEDFQSYSDAVNAFSTSADPEVVQSAIATALNVSNDNVIDLPISYSKDLVVYNSSKIAGYTFSSVPQFFEIDNVQPAE